MILDTDLGADCDDAIAIALMCRAIESGLIKSDVLTISSSREYAPSAARAILKEYLNQEFVIGKMTKQLKCDEFDYYNKDLHIVSNESNEYVSALKAMRNKLLEANHKITLVTIGPLTNLAELMEKEPKLFERKVKDVYMMGCMFNSSNPEWNIAQDIKASKYVFKHLDKPLYICPSELGNQILTGESLRDKNDSCVRLAVKKFKDNSECPDKSLSRESWDSLTVLAYLDRSYFKLSAKGKCTINVDGVSVFKENKNGNMRIVSFKNDASKIKAKEYINNAII